jgi:hypothetical protein
VVAHRSRTDTEKLCDRRDAASFEEFEDDFLLSLGEL